MRRVLFGWLLFFSAIGFVLAGGLWCALSLGILCLLGGEEYLGLTRAKGIKPSPRIIRFFIIAFFVIAALPDLPGMKLPPNFSITHFPLVLTVGICTSFFRLLFRHENPPATIADIASTVLGFIYLGWLPSHLVLLRNLVPPGMVQPSNPLLQPGLAYVWACLFAVWATDVFAYYAGKKFGKHLLYPLVSPKKTVEGAMGGFIASILLTTAVVIAANQIFPSHPFGDKLWQGPLMGAFISIAAQLGDLCESLLKRDAGVKDSSHLIPGHGGVLDRTDGLIFGCAISYYWVCHFVLGIL
jgi:phosphatidate cytidylyltransferase